MFHQSQNQKNQKNHPSQLSPRRLRTNQRKRRRALQLLERRRSNQRSRLPHLQHQEQVMRHSTSTSCVISALERLLNVRSTKIVTSSTSRKLTWVKEGSDKSVLAFRNTARLRNFLKVKSLYSLTSSRRNWAANLLRVW